MSGSRIKTIAIAALVLINVLFLTVIIMDAVADARSEREALENVCAVLRAGGIMINPDDVRGGGDIRTMRTARVPEVEEVIAGAILGQTVMADQGMILLFENNERGVAQFASAGDFEIRVYEGVITNASGTVRTVQGLIRDMRLEIADLSISFGPEEGMETVTVVGAYRGASIFNSMIEFVFSAGSLHTVGGRYVAGIEPAEDGVEISSVSTALLGFLAAVWDEGREDVMCTEISGVEAGYRHRVFGPFGEGVIDPAWLITTDNGAFIIDDATGEIFRS